MFSSISTLSGCYPYTDKDPFLIENCPHVYFVGNQDKYETRLLQGNFDPEKAFLEFVIMFKINVSLSSM